MRLLNIAVPILLEDCKTSWGVDFSGDEFKVTAPKERSSKQELLYMQKRDQYLKEQEEFMKE